LVAHDNAAAFPDDEDALVDRRHHRRQESLEQRTLGFDAATFADVPPHTDHHRCAGAIQRAQFQIDP
jgi:hypothetical protein